MCRDKALLRSQRPTLSPVSKLRLGITHSSDWTAWNILKLLERRSRPWGCHEGWFFCGLSTGRWSATFSSQEKLVVQLKSRLDEGPGWLKSSIVTAIGGPNSMLPGTGTVFSQFCMFCTMYTMYSTLMTHDKISYESILLDRPEVLCCLWSLGKEAIHLKWHPYSAEGYSWQVGWGIVIKTFLPRTLGWD